MNQPVVVPKTNFTDVPLCKISVPILVKLNPDQRRVLTTWLRASYQQKEARARYLNRLERDLVLQMLQRDPNIWGDLDANFSYLSDRQLSKIFRSVQTLNSSWHENVSALVTALLTPLRPEGMSSTSLIGSVVNQIHDFARIRRENVFRAYRLLSSSSADSLVMTAGLRETVPLYVAKVPKPGEPDHLAHEAVVGLALNSLREKIPNFVYTYSYTNCASPTFITTEPDEEKQNAANSKVTNLCDHDSVSSVLILEYVQDSVSLTQFVKNHGASDIKEVLNQISYALRYAAQELGFVHGDLHSGNVLVREFEVFVPTPTGLSKFIPVLIDYGASTICLDGLDLPSVNEVVSGWIGYPYLESWMKLDMYHLLLTLARYSVDGRPGEKEKMAVLSQMFSEWGYGNLNLVFSRPWTNEKEKIVDDQTWLNTWYYFIPKKSKSSVEIQLVPPDLWQEVLTTCSFSESVSDALLEVSTLVDFWYLLYGTSLKNVKRTLVQVEMEILFSNYNVSELLLIDVFRLKQRLLSLKLPEIQKNTDARSWIKLLEEERPVVALARDLHVLETVSSSIAQVQPFTDDSWYERNLLLGQLPTLIEHLERRKSALLEEAKKLWDKSVRTRTSDPFWSEILINQRLKELSLPN